MPEALIVLPVRGIGEVTPGEVLAEVIWAAAPWLRDGDVLVVTSKIVSKAEGRLVAVPPAEGPERDAAREAVLAAETARPVAARGPTRIVQTRHGFVLAAAGIDASNVDSGHLVLLPLDPDASARALRAGLRERSGRDVAVIITDTMGRPWRLGLTDVAIGAAGVGALLDYRGEVDAYGNDLHITQVAVIDELAAAAELVKGKTDQVPVAVVRGFLPRAAIGAPDGEGARPLIRDAESDLFSLGTAEARADGLRTAAALPEPDPAALRPAARERVLAALAAFPPTPGVRWHLVPGAGDDPVEISLTADPTGHATGDVTTGDAATGDATTGDATVDAVGLGMAVHRLRCALWADGIASARVRVPPDGSVLVRVGLAAA
jgi:coenzyme F420-0:L-glutamate ligase/coenzyme F420-1:gamma-L-glutamate ligase